MFLGCALIAGRLWKGDILVADLEIWKGEEFIFPIADGTAKLRKRPRNPRTHSKAGTTCMVWRSQWRTSRRTGRASTDRIKRWRSSPKRLSWSIQGDSIYRHHNEPRVQLYVPKEETFPFPLQYIDVTRSTHTDLDVMQEKRIDDSWNVDVNWILSERKTRMCKREAARQCSETERDVLHRSWRPRLQRMWEENLKHAWQPSRPVKEKLQMASRKCLHNRRLHPRRLQKRLPVVWWNLINPQGNEWTLLSLKIMRPHCRQRIHFRWPIVIWCTRLFLYTRRWKIRMQKLQCIKNGKSLRRSQHGNMEKVKSKKEVFLEAPRDKKKVHFATLMDKCQSRAPWWHCKRRLWSLCSFYWTGLVCVPDDCRKSNGCYCKITRLWRTSSWLSICLHSGKIGGRSQIAQNSKVRMSRRMDTSSTT